MVLTGGILVVQDVLTLFWGVASLGFGTGTMPGRRGCLKAGVTVSGNCIVHHCARKFWPYRSSELGYFTSHIHFWRGRKVHGSQCRTAQKQEPPESGHMKSVVQCRFT